MTYQQARKYLSRLVTLAEHNATLDPPITEIKVPRADLKYLLRHHETRFLYDAQGNAIVGGCRLVAI